MQKITRDNARKYAFDWRDQPLLEVDCGETFAVETLDAGSGFFKSPEDKAIPANRPGFDRTPPLSNPIAGPIWVKGVEAGDTLAVTIEHIDVEDYSWTAVGPGRGPLGDSVRWHELSGQYTTMILKHEPGESGTLRDGSVRFNERLTWPITPFIGTLGVTPDRIVPTSIDGQGPWGGNLDMRDTAPGNQILLPVYHQGARLYLGDVHASQGDTEFTGTAAETSSTVTLKVDRIAGERRNYQRIIKPDSIVAIHIARPMEAAVQQATIHMMDWLVRDHGYTQTEAYCFVGTCPDFRINVYQMCDIGDLNFVVGAEVPNKYLS